MKREIINRLGEKYLTNEGYEVTIVEYFNSYNSTVQFEDGGKVFKVRHSDIIRGKVKNKNHKGVCGIGYIGYGEYKASIDKKRTVAYGRWKGMITRCYTEKEREKYPAYEDVTVCEEWHNYQNFAAWVEENYRENFHLDKDILVKNSKVYSPETCCFVPQEINQLLVKPTINKVGLPTGVTKRDNRFNASLSKNNRYTSLGLFDTPEEAFQAYKNAKEMYIREVIYKWKHLLNINVYNRLYDYEVNIED